MATMSATTKSALHTHKVHVESAHIRSLPSPRFCSCLQRRAVQAAAIYSRRYAFASEVKSEELVQLPQLGLSSEPQDGLYVEEASSNAESPADGVEDTFDELFFEELETDEEDAEFIEEWDRNNSDMDDAAAAGPQSAFRLNFLWLERSIGLSVDQVFGEEQRSPLTEYFFWPRKDAWYELKAALDQFTWMDDIVRTELLNRAGEVINYWQDSETNKSDKEGFDKVKELFPDCMFQGL